ncbi:MAG: ACP S-malonyltransferase, partial [Fibrobacter sp.]|nr:ACP S-malonyltransferase [Fibrobacter sp.]
MSKTILLFPGQGAQYVGMGQTLAASFAPAAEIMKQADEILGFSLSKLMAEGPEEVLKSTDNTQPALYTVSAMVMELLKFEGFEFDYVAGHSLGEYSAIYAAGGFSFADGLCLVRTRGELMASAGSKNPGAMAAIMGQDEAKIQELCDQVKDVGAVVPANINCPGQIVVSGAVEGVNKLVENCAAAGIKAIPLAVSGAFHSPLMQFAQPGLAEALAKTTFNDVAKPVIANVIAEPVTSGKEISDLLLRQLVSPVRWNDCMNKAISLGVTQGVEVGSGKVLMGLMRKISR